MLASLRSMDAGDARPILPSSQYLVMIYGVHLCFGIWMFSRMSALGGKMRSMRVMTITMMMARLPRIPVTLLALSLRLRQRQRQRPRLRGYLRSTPELALPFKPLRAVPTSLGSSGRPRRLSLRRLGSLRALHTRMPVSVGTTVMNEQSSYRACLFWSRSAGAWLPL